MNNKYCDSCRGRKKILGLGMVEKNCVSCGGTGLKSVSESIEPTPQTQPYYCNSFSGYNSPEDNEPVVKRGRGRPRKVA